MEHALPSYILQARVQVLDPLHNVVNFSFVLALNLARLADSQVKVQPEPALRLAHVQPAVARVAAVRHCNSEAETVLAGFGSGEGEAAFARASLIDDPVVIVESFLQVS